MPGRGSPRLLLPSQAMRWKAHQVLRSPWPSFWRGRAACSHARHQCGSHDEIAAIGASSAAKQGRRRSLPALKAKSHPVIEAAAQKGQARGVSAASPQQLVNNPLHGLFLTFMSSSFCKCG